MYYIKSISTESAHTNIDPTPPDPPLSASTRAGPEAGSSVSLVNLRTYLLTDDHMWPGQVRKRFLPADVFFESRESVILFGRRFENDVER